MQFNGKGDRVQFPEEAKTELIFEGQPGVIKWKTIVLGTPGRRNRCKGSKALHNYNSPLTSVLSFSYSSHSPLYSHNGEFRGINSIILEQRAEDSRPIKEIIANIYGESNL